VVIIFFFQAEDGIRDFHVTGVQTCALPISRGAASGDGWGMTATGAEYDDQGGASRFFPTFRYEAKAPTEERPRVNGVAHPTVKQIGRASCREREQLTELGGAEKKNDEEPQR